MRTIAVTVCTGTACYVLGGSELLTLKDRLPEEYAKCVLLAGSPCLDRCRDRADGKRPPYVSVDGKTHGGVDMEELIDLVMEAVGGRHAGIEE